MNDIIDLGNLVFNHLVEQCSELEESRVLFLYGITQGTPWQIIDSDKWVTVTVDGIAMNFEDQALTDLHDQWHLIVNAKKTEAMNQLISKLKGSTRELKDGDIVEFGASSGEFREINFSL
jgi:hypothetical protein